MKLLLATMLLLSTWSQAFADRPGRWTPPSSRFIHACTIDSSFDGKFLGLGWSHLQARQEAEQACKDQSRSNGFFCKSDSITCDTSTRGNHYCLVKSTFDGSFSGSGWTRLHALYEAEQACRAGSTNNGFFCKVEEAECE